MKRTFVAFVEWDQASELYVGFVPGIPGGHTQAKSLDELRANLKEVLELCLEELASNEPMPDLPEFVGLQQIEVGT